MRPGLLALRGLVIKELRQVRRDPRLLSLLLLAPLIQLFIFGYAATLDVATARVAVLDGDRSPESRAFIARLAVTEGFEIAAHVSTDVEAERLLGRGSADLAVILPAGYGRAVAGRGTSAVQILVDGTDTVAASIGLAGASGLLASIAREIGQQRASELPGAQAPTLLIARTRVFFNPELRSRIFLVPGVLALVLMLVTMVATSMAIVREKELGTLEQLVVTPVSRTALLAGKLIPFALFGLVVSLAVLAIAHFWFRVPLEGSAALLLVNVVPFLLGTLGLGLLVSIVSNTQQQAMMTATFFVMLPMIYLSGFVFPIESMPAPVRPLTELVPLRHFLEILRGVMLKGSGVRALWPEILALTGLGLSVFGLAIALFPKRLG